MSEPSLDCNPFEKVAAEFAERVRRGEHPSMTEYIERYPDLADDIRELFPMLAVVEQFKPAAHESAAEPTNHTGPSSSDHPQQLGDYRILRYLGEGGMGVVYEAVRESLSNHVALKVMHPQFRNREKYLRLFRTEARSAARLHHTNIVSVFDYGAHDGTYYYAMQYIAGQSLDRILEDVRRLREEKEQASPGTTATVSWAPRGISALASKVSGDTGLAGDSLKQAVTVGFLTGIYEPEARTSGTESSAAATPALTRSIAADEAADAASPLSQLADFPLGQIGIGNTHNVGRIADPSFSPGGRIGNPSYEGKENHHAGRDDCNGPIGSTSTLAGKVEDRYHREVARLGAQIADGLAYAHKRGVFHRDIKPSNLILDPMGNIWITDFGLAKFEDGEDVSQSRDAVGTLRYMAPERFKGLSDGRCDIYALGATLYEMLTLRPAFAASNPIELIQQIESDSPVRLRQIDGRISRDLETIILKALAKNPNDRFTSASAMAQELRRYLENRPIKSRPIPFYQQFWRWCQRNPGLASANIAAATLTTVLAVVSTIYALTYRGQVRFIAGQRDSIRKAEIEGRAQLFNSLVSHAQSRRLSHRMGQRFESLEVIKKAAHVARGLRLPPARLEELRDQAIACMALPDLKPTERVITRTSGVIGFTFDSGMTRYALRFGDGTILVRRVADDQEIARFHARGDREISLFRLSPDGRYLATTNMPDSSLTVWNVDRREVAIDDPGPLERWQRRDHFSPDSRRIAVIHERGELVVYELGTNQSSRRCRPKGPGAFRSPVAYGPNGTQIAVAFSDRKNDFCHILQADTLSLVRAIGPLPAGPDGLAWSPDGATLAMACYDRKIYLWDAATGLPKGTLEGLTNGGFSVAFHPAGTVLASNGFEGRLRLWDPVLCRPLLSLVTWMGPQFSRDGRIVDLAEDKLTTYEVDPALEYRTFALCTQPSESRNPSIRHGGRVLAIAVDARNGVVLWDLARGVELTCLRIGHTWNCHFESSGDLITNGSIGVWRWPVHLDVKAGEFCIGPPRQLPLPGGAHLAEDHSGRIVAVANHRFVFLATPEGTVRVGPLDDCRGVSVSPDGQWLSTHSHAGTGGQIWRVRDRTKVKDLPVTGGLFSPDGKWLLAPGGRLLEVGNWREVRTIKGGRVSVFSPDGRMVVAVDSNQVLALNETETGRTLARLESPDLSENADLAFSPDGSRLVTNSNEGRGIVHVWDLRLIRRRLAEMGLDWDAPPYPESDSAAEDAPLLPLHVQVDLGRIKPIRPEVRSLLQQVQRLEHDGKIAEAIAALRQGTRSLPNEDQIHNSLAWLLATGPEPLRNTAEAVEHARRAVELRPGYQLSLNTLGVALYRAGKFAEAVETLEKSQRAGTGQLAAFDLFFMAMAHHKLGHAQEARKCFNEAEASFESNRASLSPDYLQELTKFGAEAERVLAGDGADLPAEVFAREH